MTERNTLCAIITLIACNLMGSMQAGEKIHAVSAQEPNSGQLLTVDLDTGETEAVGPKGMGIGLRNTVGLAARPSDGELFLDANNGASSGLHRLDRDTGLATYVGSNSPFNEVAFDDDDRLYTQIVLDNVGATGPLGIADIDTGHATDLGGPDLPRLFGLAFNPSDGMMYGADSNGSTLFKILLDGSLHSSMPINGSTGTIGALLFTSEGALLGSNLSGQIFEINPVTGALSNFRTTENDFDPQGMALIFVPEQASMSTLLFAVLISCASGLPRIVRRSKTCSALPAARCWWSQSRLPLSG